MRHAIVHCSICRVPTDDEMQIGDWRAGASEIANLIAFVLPFGAAEVSYVCRTCYRPIAEITRDAVIGRRDFLYAEATRKAEADHGR